MPLGEAVEARGAATRDQREARAGARRSMVRPTARMAAPMQRAMTPHVRMAADCRPSTRPVTGAEEAEVRGRAGQADRARAGAAAGRAAQQGRGPAASAAQPVARAPGEMRVRRAEPAREAPDRAAVARGGPAVRGVVEARAVEARAAAEVATVEGVA